MKLKLQIIEKLQTTGEQRKASSMVNCDYLDRLDRFYTLCDKADKLAKRALEGTAGINGAGVYRTAHLAVSVYANSGKLQKVFSLNDFVISAKKSLTFTV